MFQQILRAIATHKGLERPHLTALAGAGFIYTWTTIKASAPCVKARRDDYIEGICSPGSLGPNPGRTQLDRAASLLRSHEEHREYVLASPLLLGGTMSRQLLAASPLQLT